MMIGGDGSLSSARTANQREGRATHVSDQDEPHAQATLEVPNEVPAEVPAWATYTERVELPPVLEHALRAFVDVGYHATTVRHLANRLGQTVPAIYYHYESKEAVLAALLSYSIDDLLERCSQAEAPADPLTRFSAIVRCIVLFVAHRRELAFLDVEIRSLEAKNRKAYVAKRDEMESIVTRAVVDGMSAGVFAPGDSHSVSRAIITMCRGIANWYRPYGALSPDDLADQYVIYARRLAGHADA